MMGVAAVRDYWEREACGERYGADHERVRYELEPEVLHLANFEHSRGLDVLEIGVGMGADFVRWLRAGAHATGVDLTERAVTITRERVEKEGFEADLRVADAEALPFPDASFALVYSWGVLHHTPDTRRAVNEAIRVLRPGGVLRLMLYHRRSWVARAAWVRYGLLHLRPDRSLAQAVAKIQGPSTHAFTVAEAESLMSPLGQVRVRPHVTHWDRRAAPGLSHIGGNRFGWFLLIEGRKPLRSG